VGNSKNQCVSMVAIFRCTAFLVLLLCAAGAPLRGAVKDMVAPKVPDVDVIGGEPVGNYQRKTQACTTKQSLRMIGASLPMWFAGAACLVLPHYCVGAPVCACNVMHVHARVCACAHSLACVVLSCLLAWLGRCASCIARYAL
jgi:hypothetical protein